jgi:hypothetical protein
VVVELAVIITLLALPAEPEDFMPVAEAVELGMSVKVALGALAAVAEETEAIAL